MKKFIKILLTVSVLITCFGVNTFADVVYEDVTFPSDGNDTDTNLINTHVEYNDVKIAEGAEVIINESGNLVIHGTFVNNGANGGLLPVEGAHIAFDDITKADGQIAIFDHWGNDFAETPSGFMELEYVGDKWMQFFASPEFVSSNNGADENKIDGFIEYVNVTIQAGAEVVITEGSVLAVHGTFTNNGTLSPGDGAHIVLDNVETATGITIYDSEGNSFVEPPSGFKEFEFNDGKWKEFIPPTEVTYAVSYDINAGGVWHYEEENFVKIDSSSEPYEYRVTGEDKIYILENPGWAFDHIEAEGDDPENPENSIINKEGPSEEIIEGTTYKVVRITPNPKDNDFYYFEVRFAKDPNLYLAEKLNTLELAFDATVGSDDSKLKDYIANQIYERYLSSGSHYRVENTIFSGCTFEEFKGKVIIITDDTEPTKDPVQIDGSEAEYFKFKLDGLDNFVGIVYKLNGTDQFVLRDGNSYTIIDVGEEGVRAAAGEGAEALKDFDAVQGGKIVVRTVNNTVNKEESEEGPNYEIFGNYAGFPMNYTGRMQDSQDTKYISIEQVMPCASNGIDTSAFSSLGCEMILYSKNFLGVCIMNGEKAKPWSKENLPIYPTNSGDEEATVFYASDSAIISSPYGAPAASTIKNVTFSNGSTKWNDCSIEGSVGDTFEITFGSIFYDKVPLIITYTNGTTNSFVIARTGISIGDYPAPGGEDSVNICEETVEFTDDNRWVIAAPFYYANSSPEESDRVSLFVKITENDGTVVTKLVSDTINNSGIHTDDSGYTYNKYDVFELWRGKFDGRPEKIEVIAFVEGDDDSFGGVKLGSGSGIKWTQERGRQ